MKQPLLFNPDGSDLIEDRKIWGGNTTNLMNLNNVKYKWAYRLYKQMREQFWEPDKMDITADANDYMSLTEGERKTFNGVLSYLTFLDSIQGCILTHLKQKVTAPEINLCFGEQISQEIMHNASYQKIIETIIPSEDRNKVYDYWRTDKVLKNRCKYIANLYQEYIDNQTEENYYFALVADFLLEGLYFYNGFITFFSLASRGLMSGSADIIGLINR